jgi:hypothetical protein
VPLSYRYGDVVAPYADLREKLPVEDQHFVESPISGRRLLSDGENGLAVVRNIEAANQSIRTGQQLRPFPRVYPRPYERRNAWLPPSPMKHPRPMSRHRFAGGRPTRSSADSTSQCRSSSW